MHSKLVKHTRRVSDSRFTCCPFDVFFIYYRDHRDLHSFPTRRSSDLISMLPPPPPIPDMKGSTTPRVAPTATAAWWSPSCRDRKSTRLNSSHSSISYAVFCLKKKKTQLSPSSISNLNADSLRF